MFRQFVVMRTACPDTPEIEKYSHEADYPAPSPQLTSPTSAGQSVCVCGTTISAEPNNASDIGQQCRAG